jgi:hypothetical protein
VRGCIVRESQTGNVSTCSVGFSLRGLLCPGKFKAAQAEAYATDFWIAPFDS